MYSMDGKVSGEANEEDGSNETPQSSFKGGFKFTGVVASKPMSISLRLEDPYFTPTDPARYQTVVCLVAATDISGALAIQALSERWNGIQLKMTKSGVISSRPSCPIGNAVAQIQTQNGRADSTVSVGR
jgi:hypothetical protein